MNISDELYVYCFEDDFGEPQEDELLRAPYERAHDRFCWITNGKENKRVEKEEALFIVKSSVWRVGYSSGKRLSKREQALELIKQGKTMFDISKELGVNRTTLWRWGCKKKK